MRPLRLSRSISANRIARVILHLARAFLLFPLVEQNRGEFRQRWSRQLLAILGVRLEYDSIRIAPGTLVVANHVSWLDVIAMSAFYPMTFVAKAEIRSWPVLGWLGQRSGCLFVNRRVGRHLLRLNSAIATRLAAGGVVAFFPEGTTTDGAGVLPFRPALFEPAIRGTYCVQPFAVTYRDAAGRCCATAAFIGRQSLWQSLCAIAALPELVASVAPCGPISPQGLTRRDLARRAQSAVQERLWGGRSLPARQKFAAMPVGTVGSASAPGTAPSSTAPMWASRAAVSRT